MESLFYNIKQKGGWFLLFLNFIPLHAETDGQSDWREWQARTQGETIVITASRNPENKKEEATTTLVIERNYLARGGFHTVADPLGYQQGLNISYDNARGEHLTMGGLPPEYSLILINGRRVIGKNDNATNLSRLLANDIGQIEIVKGASSAIYGSEAIGGVVNIITRPVSAPLEYSATVAGGELGRFNLDLVTGFSLESVSNKLDISHRQLDTYQLSKEDPQLRGRGFSEWQVFDQLLFKPADGWELGTEWNVLARDEGGVGRRVARNGTVSYLDETKLTHMASGSLFSRAALSETQQLNLDINYSWFFDRYNEDYHDPAKTDTRTDTTERFANTLTHYNINWSAANSLSLGMENIWEDMTSDRIAGGLQQRIRHAVYAENKWLAYRPLNIILQPALRYDAIDDGSSALSPRFAFRTDPVKDLTFKLGYGMGFRAPTLKELNYEFNLGMYRIEGNPNLRPETSVSYNAELSYAITRHIALMVSGYHHNIRDKINRMFSHYEGTGPIPLRTQVFIHDNIEQVESNSLEAGSDIRLMRFFTLHVGYTHTVARDLTNDRPLDGQALHRANLNFIFDYYPLGLTTVISGLWVSERPFYDKTLKTTEYRDAYEDIRVRITKQLYRETSLFLTGENLTNRYNESTLIRPPRTFWGGIRVTNF